MCDRRTACCSAGFCRGLLSAAGGAAHPLLRVDLGLYLVCCAPFASVNALCLLVAPLSPPTLSSVFTRCQFSPYSIITMAAFLTWLITAISRLVLLLLLLLLPHVYGVLYCFQVWCSCGLGIPQRPHSRRGCQLYHCGCARKSRRKRVRDRWSKTAERDNNPFY